jgi:PHD/YefM family antitoxin component YafN of YafNO toxin-antitoxin module
MPSTTVSKDEFEHDLAQIEQATKAGPLFIMEDGQPSFVVLSMEEYKRLTECAEEYERLKKPFVSLADALADEPLVPDFDFIPGRLNVKITPSDLS